METLPDVWNKLVSEPDCSIVNLVAERTHKLCVREPDRDEVEQFLSRRLEQIQTTLHPTTPEPVPPLEQDPSLGPIPSDSVTGKKPAAFTFDGSRYEVTSWRGMLIRLCEIVHSAHRDRFEEVLSIRGTAKSPFSRNDSGMAAPEQISDTGIFVETFGNAKAIVKRAERLITHFGYSENDLSYEGRTL